MKAVAVHFLGDIHGIVDSALAVDDGVVEHNAIVLYYGVVGADSGTSRTSSTSDDSGVKAFATREGKEYYSHTQCQDESQ